MLVLDLATSQGAHQHRLETPLTLGSGKDLTSAMTACREMMGFPNITADNDCILARYDNALVDAKPWGRGQGRLGVAWVTASQPLDRALNMVDGRHPLATAQFINHPPPGTKPNVLLAPFDLRLADGVLPAPPAQQQATRLRMLPRQTAGMTRVESMSILHGLLH